MILAPITIPSLTKLPDKTWRQEFKLILADFVTLTPIQGWLTVQHQGTYLRVATEAKTIMTLTCDRCLQQYNHRLICQVEELIWLETDDLKDDLILSTQELDLLERLPAQGEFDPQDWLYQNLCLALPHPQICQADCRGLGVEQIDQQENERESPECLELTTGVDHRWANLATLKEKLEG
jgi:uncharacterized protein